MVRRADLRLRNLGSWLHRPMHPDDRLPRPWVHTREDAIWSASDRQSARPEPTDASTETAAGWFFGARLPPSPPYQEQEVPDAQAVVLSLLGPAETAIYDVVPSYAGQPTRCRADDLRLSVTQTASVMSQPFSDIAVTNTGTQTCVLSGYPRIHAQGHPEGTDPDPSTVMQLPIAVRRGRSYERIDPGPHPVVIQPLHEVFFSIGTATAFQGGRHLITLTRLTIVLPVTNAPKTLPINLLASKPPGRRIPVTITAIGPSPQG